MKKLTRAQILEIESQLFGVELSIKTMTNTVQRNYWEEKLKYVKRLVSKRVRA